MLDVGVIFKIDSYVDMVSLEAQQSTQIEPQLSQPPTIQKGHHFQDRGISAIPL